MNLLAFIEAALKLGIPMVVLSWIIFAWLYGGGGLAREADRKTINASIKKMRKSFKKTSGRGGADYLASKWFWFGGGFYGLAGLWTFAVIEAGEIVGLIMNPSVVANSLDDGLLAAAIDLLVNQITNLLTALLWFGYWADEGVLVWLLVAYAGYWIGVELARRGEEPQIQALLRRLRALIPFP